MTGYVTDIEYTSEKMAGDGVLRMRLAGEDRVYLLGTSHCTYVTIWWDAESDEHDASLKIYAVEEIDGANDIITRQKKWYDLDIPRAIAWVEENLG